MKSKKQNEKMFLQQSSTGITYRVIEMLSALPTHQSQSKSRQNNHKTFMEKKEIFWKMVKKKNQKQNKNTQKEKKKTKISV